MDSRNETDVDSNTDSLFTGCVLGSVMLSQVFFKIMVQGHSTSVLISE